MLGQSHEIVQFLQFTRGYQNDDNLEGILLGLDVDFFKAFYKSFFKLGFIFKNLEKFYDKNLQFGF